MPTTILKVANVHFTQTGNNRLEYTGNGVVRLTANGIQVPVGTSEARPTGEAGIIRYNTTLESFEGHNGTGWANIVSGIIDLSAANNWANTVASASAVSANIYSRSIGDAGNTYVRTVGDAGNTYIRTVGDAANTLSLTRASAANGWTNTVFGFSNTKFFANSTGTFAGSLTTTGSITDNVGPVRVIPINSQSSPYTLIKSDVGKFISITTGGITVPADVFAAGDAVSIYNNSGSSQTITQGASVTVYLGGTATTGNRTLAQRGIATVLCVAVNTFVITGSGLS